MKLHLFNTKKNSDCICLHQAYVTLTDPRGGIILNKYYNIS